MTVKSNNYLDTFSAKSMMSFILLFVLVVPYAQAENRWVTDEFEVMMRKGKSTSQSIIRQL